MRPRVDVVMLTWNQIEFTRRAIASYRSYVKAPHRLICIDNGSTDGTVEYLRGEADLLIASSTNVGAVRGRNIGWAVSDADYILSTDNDVEFATDIVERLVTVADAHPELGIVGPLLNEHLGQAGLPTNLPLPVITSLVETENAGGLKPAGYVPGCALFRRRMIDAIGGWDTAYDTWAFEEYDYCQRAKAAGWGVAVAMDCYVHHHGNTSIGQLQNREALAAKNRELFLSRWGIRVGEQIGIVDPGLAAASAEVTATPDTGALADHVRQLRCASAAPSAAWPAGGVEALLGRLPDLGKRMLVLGAAPADAVRGLRHLYAREATGLAPEVGPAPPYAVETGEAHAIPAPDAHYDGILAIESLERSPMPLMALLEMRRVTRPGGLIALLMPPMEPAWLARPGHFSLLTDIQWRALFGAAGLELLDARAEGASGDPRVRYIVRRPVAAPMAAGRMGA